jgi:hypothetical protein
MHKSLMIAAALAAAAAGEAGAQAPTEASDADRSVLAFAQERGRLLFELDRAAWVGTDDFITRMPDYQDQGVRGYFVERSGPGYAVTFFGGPPEATVAFYRGEVRDRRVASRQVFRAESRPALTPEQRRLVAAREAAARAVRGRPCGAHPFNTAVVPPDSIDGPIDVYLMTPQVDEGVFPMGGHFRLTVDASGQAGRERKFTNSCLLIGTDASRGAASPAALAVTHLLDRVPTEMHVFTALTSGLPLFVGISEPERLYEVTGREIRPVPEQ